MPRIDEYPEIAAVDDNDLLLIEHDDAYKKAKKKEFIKGNLG